MEDWEEEYLRGGHALTPYLKKTRKGAPLAPGASFQGKNYRQFILPVSTPAGAER